MTGETTPQNFGKKLLNGKGIFTFLRSAVSSLSASGVDMIVRITFYAFVFKFLDPFYRSNLSVAIGAISGGIVNCCVNYKFTFHADGQNVKAIAIKYIIVWVCSLLLNMYGTTYCALALSKWSFLINLGFRPDGIFTTSTLVVSLLVSWFWNFPLQKNFVYRPRSFDRYAIRLVDTLTLKKNRS